MPHDSTCIHKRANNQGFTLIELMVAVTIVAILVNMALPLSRVFKIKAARAEARVNTDHGYTLVRTYMSENSTQPNAFQYGVLFFADGTTTADGKTHPDGSADCNYIGIGYSEANKIGFRLQDCLNLRYIYYFSPSRDAIGGGQIDTISNFSMMAISSHSHLVGSTAGRGFGFNPTACYHDSFFSYYENLGINQDRDFGLQGKNVLLNYSHTLYDAIFHCSR